MAATGAVITDSRPDCGQSALDVHFSLDAASTLRHFFSDPGTQAGVDNMPIIGVSELLPRARVVPNGVPATTLSKAFDL